MTVCNDHFKLTPTQTGSLVFMSRLVGKSAILPIALLALLLNAMGQVACCSDVWSPTTHMEHSALSEALCLDGDDGDPAHLEERRQAFEKWTLAVGLRDASKTEHDHGDAGCDCPDGACGGSAPGLLKSKDLIAGVNYEGPVQFTATSLVEDRPQFQISSPRGPPSFLV